MNKLYVEIECKEKDVQYKLAPYNHVMKYVRKFVYSQRDTSDGDDVYIAFALSEKALRYL